MRWRFGNDPQLQYRVLAVEDADGRLRGSAIYLFPELGESLPLGAIIDLLPTDAVALDALLAALSRHLRHMGVVGVQTLYFGSPLIEAGLSRFQFFRRDSEFRLLAYLHPRLKDHQADLLDPSRWHVTDAEAKF
jgi:hypothetical protein